MLIRRDPWNNLMIGRFDAAEIGERVAVGLIIFSAVGLMGLSVFVNVSIIQLMGCG